MAHMWTVDEDIAVMALTRKYGKIGWETDPLATALISQRGVTKGSLGMAVQNCLFLMGLPGGLNHPSERQRESFRVYSGQNPQDLQKLAEERMGV